METKTCSKCNVEKPFTDFHKCSLNKAGFKSACKECRNSSERTEYAKNPQPTILRTTEWGKNNRGSRIKATRKYQNNNPDSTRNTIYTRKYGITLQEYDLLFTSQNGVCAICGNEQTNKRLSVDHNHETGEVRGLLCSKCNHAIGLFKDNIKYMANAIAYLEKEKIWPQF
jgi:hypothetical protein